MSKSDSDAPTATAGQVIDRLWELLAPYSLRPQLIDLPIPGRYWDTSITVISTATWRTARVADLAAAVADLAASGQVAASDDISECGIVRITLAAPDATWQVALCGLSAAAENASQIIEAS